MNMGNRGQSAKRKCQNSCAIGAKTQKFESCKQERITASIFSLIIMLTRNVAVYDLASHRGLVSLIEYYARDFQLHFYYWNQFSAEVGHLRQWNATRFIFNCQSSLLETGSAIHANLCNWISLRYRRETEKEKKLGKREKMGWKSARPESFSLNNNLYNVHMCWKWYIQLLVTLSAKMHK